MDSIIGYGGVTRDHNGNYMLGFTGPTANCDENFSITYVVLHCLSLCSNLNYMNVVVEVASYFDYHSLNSKEDKVCSSALFYIRRDIRNLLSILNNSFSVILEEGNACSQSIARWGFSLNAMTEILVPILPFKVKGLLRLNQIGLSYVTS
ncbi:uncharacterized protein LOC110098515 [Dendrobium catenatum]|uniref:uncharacterized protein LOC110098515 n=1 Tax=Dendrobium catenatum TaxID=906689 RepID=UPI0009F6F5BB|nr:uncharacterized protein LOC110098515 [Dendrobium catenatum]